LLVPTHLPGGLLQGLNEDSLAVQLAISDKMGAFLQHITTFVVGYIIAFWRGWDMTLVMVGCLPFLAAAGAVMARVATSLGNKQAEAYTEVGWGGGGGI
jgi:ATP-binding cassette subfamily B (MDR/TAP) protein 1